MRQLIVSVPRGKGRDALAIAKSHGGANLALLEAEGAESAFDLLLVNASNQRIEALLGDLQCLPDLHVTLAPQGVITLRPPASDTPNQALDVTTRSPVEIFLGGLQSVGSWTGFLGYAAAGGMVVWIGLFTNTVYLLTAAMLIAPFAGPAMNAALATARGDVRLFGRSVLRYFASLAVTITVAFLLSVLFGQSAATQQMVSTSNVASVTALLPLVAGAAGALNLCQSERSSLVSGAATGMLVAASLAPPAGLVGMSAAMGEWEMAGAGVFILLLQLVGINVSGAVVFRLFGLTSRGVRYEHGQRWMAATAWAGSAAVLAGLLVWQLSDRPGLQRSSVARRAEAEVQQAVQASGLAKLVQAEVGFTRADIPGQDTLLVRAYVQAERAPSEEVRQGVSQAIRSHLRARFDATPLVDVTVLDK